MEDNIATTLHCNELKFILRSEQLVKVCVAQHLVSRKFQIHLPGRKSISRASTQDTSSEMCDSGACLNRGVLVFLHNKL